MAYVGEIGEDEGTQFTSDVPYAKNGHPQWAYWYPPEHGGDSRVRQVVANGESFACVDIVPDINRYRCR